MADLDDPRVFFAAERTLLAWLRTGLAIVGLGFLVARFGLFLRMVSEASAEEQPQVLSSLIGIGFVCLGSLVMAISARQHYCFTSELKGGQRPVRYWIRFGVWSAATAAVFGIALAVYLMWSVARAVSG